MSVYGARWNNKICFSSYWLDGSLYTTFIFFKLFHFSVIMLLIKRIDKISNLDPVQYKEVAGIFVFLSARIKIVVTILYPSA